MKISLQLVKTVVAIYDTYTWRRFEIDKRETFSDDSKKMIVFARVSIYNYWNPSYHIDSLIF